ncbi:lipopolysaccharide heptosyltransferase family protein [Candidatus Pelagibacter sp.]|nr:lipopolysaccharide heptosyltransferase family protein [Candidatus Pelagibacter sp.]
MKVGVFLNYIGLGANVMHLSYCHHIAKVYGPITLITLSKNLDQALEDDPLINEIKIFEKNKNITDIPKISSGLKQLNLDMIFIFYPSPRLYFAAKFAGIKKVFCYPLLKKKQLHLVEAAKTFTCKHLNLSDCETETKIYINQKKIDKTKIYFDNKKCNLVIGAGSSGQSTRWGENNFSNLLNELNNKGEFFFFIQAGPDQKNISQKIINNVKKKNCMDLSNISIRELVPFFVLCDMYVGNDSFMHHVTSQSQKPAIVLLINSPRAYTDYSKNYHRIIPPNADINKINHSFLYSPNSISVEAVKNKVLELKPK